MPVVFLDIYYSMSDIRMWLISIGALFLITAGCWWYLDCM